MEKYGILASEKLERGDKIYLINSNCEFTYDSTTGGFCNLSDVEEYIVEVEILEEDLSEYRPEKSNNGGCYAYATATVVEVG